MQKWGFNVSCVKAVARCAIRVISRFTAVYLFAFLGFMAIWHAMCEHFLGFSRGFTNFSGNWSSHFMGNLDIFLKDYIANRCKSTKLHQNRYARASSAACKASKRQQASLTYTRDNVHSGRRSIMRGPDAPCFALRYATKRSWRDAH